MYMCIYSIESGTVRGEEIDEEVSQLEVHFPVVKRHPVHAHEYVSPVVSGTEFRVYGHFAIVDFVKSSAIL